MESVGQRFFGLCLPPLLLCLLDYTLTLLGQSQEYWEGDYARVNEMSPVFHDLLQVHPLACIAGGVVWAVVMVSCILLVPGTLALAVSIGVTLGHTVGAATWILYGFAYGYQACNVLFLVSAILLAVGIRWGWRPIPHREYRLTRWPPLVRWGLVTVLFGVPAYLFLWPHQPRSPGQGLPQEVEAVASTDRELEQLAKVPRLSRLSLLGSEITDAGLQHLKRMSHLQGHSLRGARVTEAGLEHLAGMAELKFLYFEDVPMEDASLDRLKGIARLEGLTLCGPWVTDASLEHLKGLSQLLWLQIDSTKVTDAGLKHLQGLSRLQTVNLVGTMVTSAGLEHLKGLSQLEYLILRETRITDPGLQHLKGLSRLRVLYLHGTNCTPQGKKELQQALPKCRIEG